ncbi:YbaN family protein [bacterium 210820-DFI.6.37]|nr:YbaN family protein [bacterium 210820-DFI.6.37]
MKKVINGICVGLAFLCVAIGAVGIVLPFLPTTPFFILAAALFAKGSARFHRWFLSTSLYKKHLDDLVRTKAMTKKSKCSVLASITVLLTIGFFLSPIWHAKVVIVIVALAHYYVFLFRIRTITEEEKSRLRGKEDVS